ncbi:hypothetical protein GGU10DRAFT_387931 [Lentinula aff. detonsa]|uniref:RRM domain-containing protein n=1 Tax=Lentinula aff. detonsa TaxID=2804958 RepID=A0AA38K9T9_9AGAR|nr:hypothetical protein GGU10DRAFT_387931 [Lentinula aff. detonsa]
MQRVQIVSRLVAQSHVPIPWRSLNRSLSSNQSFIHPPARLPARRPVDAVEARIGHDGSPNSVRLRFWHSPRDSADILAAAQYMEQVYGPIDEFNCPSMNNGRKSLSMFVRFKDPESASRATAITGSHRIPAPTIPRADPIQGGISLASLESFLDTKPLQPELMPQLSEPDPSEKYDHRKDASREFLYFQIQDAHDIRSPPGKTGAQVLSKRAIRAFVRWAGFNSIKPLQKNTPLFEQGDAVDYPIMRHVVARYANVVDMRNPLVTKTQPDISPAAERIWIAPLKPSVEKNDNVEGEAAAVASEASPSPSSITSEDVFSSPSTEADVIGTLAANTPTPSSPPPHSPKPVQALVKSPEAIAQLRIANSILRNIHKPSKAKTRPHPQTKAKGNSTSPQIPQRLEKSPSTMSATHKGHPVPAEVEGKSIAVDTEKSATSKIRGFIGQWF